MKPYTVKDKLLEAIREKSADLLPEGGRLRDVQFADEDIMTGTVYLRILLDYSDKKGKRRRKYTFCRPLYDPFTGEKLSS